jgi:hypothetical protein
MGMREGREREGEGERETSKRERGGRERRIPAGSTVAELAMIGRKRGPLGECLITEVVVVCATHNPASPSSRDAREKRLYPTGIHTIINRGKPLLGALALPGAWPEITTQPG